MLIAFVAAALLHPAKPDLFAEGFKNPPAWSRPHTWWHWMDGNVTKEGITADLEAMKQVGIGGAQMFTVDQGIPHGPVDYNSPEWRKMIAFAVKEAGRLGLELCIHNCAGWSSSGGPWITPENAMQVVAWSTVQVQGPKQFSETLPPIKAPNIYASVPYSKDIAVYAYPTPAEGDNGKTDPNFLGKTGVIRQDNLLPELGAEPSGIAMPLEQIKNISAALDASGRLTWNVPDGNWTILRMGHVPTGKDNHPAPPEGDGLEVDKLSREAMDAHWAGMMAKVIAECGPLAGKVLNNSLIDSYEVHTQNWTPKFREEFLKRRGYDPMPYLPAISGLTVESKETTERFYWDVRRTIADLFADNYFGYFGELCHKAGMKFSTEPYGDGGFDPMQSGSTADIPMGEFWIGGSAMETTKLASSIGHVYDRPVIGAESFTADDVRGKWLEEPYAAKTTGDLVFCNGVNRYIFHRYAMQPWLNLKPGMTMGPWGTHLERTQTWWTEAASWLKYVARCQYLLQQGHFVGDILYYSGEGVPCDWTYGPQHNPQPPKGYDYDDCDTNTLLHRLQVQNGNLVLPNGAKYKVLVLPESKFMTPAVASKLLELAKAGAAIVGSKPERSPSLTGFPSCDGAVKSAANELWGDVDGKTVRERKVGLGTVVWGDPLQEVLKEAGLPPDFEVHGLTSGTKLIDIHRRIEGTDFYFVSNQQYSSAEANCTFRVSGRVPELWHPDTGLMEDAPIYEQSGDRTTVNLTLQPAESVFVVFRKAGSSSHVMSFDPADRAQVQSSLPKVEIIQARYESKDGRGSDVTETVRSMVADGNYEIAATNSNFGDPVVNVVKQLTIEFSVNGAKSTKTVGENETISLIESPKQNAPALSYSVTKDASGIWLTAWKSGTFYNKNSAGGTKTVVVTQKPSTLDLSKEWDLAFAPNWGAPSHAHFSQLISWTDHQNTGIKYFSGSTVYKKSFNVPASMLGSGKVVLLDLGKVKNFATVRLNGKELAVLWKEPFVVDISNSLKSGSNSLEVKVTNLWPNRIIGDEQLPPDVEWNGVTLKQWPDWLKNGGKRPKTGRYTFTTWRFWNKDSKLLESGLLGPVMIRSTKRVKIAQ